MKKKEEKDIIDFGSFNIPTSWDDVTLDMYEQLERFYSDKEEKFDARDVLHIFTNKSVDEINALPYGVAEFLLERLSFLNEPPKTVEPTNKIEINGVEYMVNIKNKLKTGEYIQTDTVLRADKHAYSSILAILCRKKDEIYDLKFENEELEKRIELFKSVPITKVLPVVAFFLQCYMILETPSKLSSILMEEISHTQKNIDDSLKDGELTKRQWKSLTKKLKKLTNSIKSI